MCVRVCVHGCACACVRVQEEKEDKNIKPSLLQSFKSPCHHLKQHSRDIKPMVGQPKVKLPFLESFPLRREKTTSSFLSFLLLLFHFSSLHMLHYFLGMVEGQTSEYHKGLDNYNACM